MKPVIAAAPYTPSVPSASTQVMVVVVYPESVRQTLYLELDEAEKLRDELTHALSGIRADDLAAINRELANK